MGRPEGFALYWRDQYCVSLTTGAGDDGTHHILLSAVGEDIHHHWWFQVKGGAVVGGVRMKERGDHIGPSRTFQGLTTEPLAKARLEWHPESQQVTCQLVELFQESTVAASRITARMESSPKAHIDLLGATDALAAEYTFRLADINSSRSLISNASIVGFLGFSGEDSLGVLLQLESRST